MSNRINAASRSPRVYGISDVLIMGYQGCPSGIILRAEQKSGEEGRKRRRDEECRIIVGDR